MFDYMLEMTNRPPFTSQLDHERRYEAMRALREQLTAPEPPPDVPGSR